VADQQLKHLLTGVLALVVDSRVVVVVIVL